MIRFSLVVLLSLLLLSCAGQKMRNASSVVDYLYSGEQTKIEPSISHLTLPIKLGIAFVPENGSRSSGFNVWTGQSYGNNFSEIQKSKLLEKVSKNFEDLGFIKEVSLIPSNYLRPKGGFENLDQISTMYGVDVVALVSYDQVQFTDEDYLSLSYWTLIGAYFVSGEKNDTSTMLDTAVYDIESRSMLFRAPGTSSVRGRATPINLSEELRKDSAKGFDLAAENMVKNLELELSKFKEKIKNKSEKVKISHEEGYSGAGSIGILQFVILSIGLFFKNKKSNKSKHRTL